MPGAAMMLVPCMNQGSCTDWPNVSLSLTSTQYTKPISLKNVLVEAAQVINYINSHTYSMSFYCRVWPNGQDTDGRGAPGGLGWGCCCGSFPATLCVVERRDDELWLPWVGYLVAVSSEVQKGSLSPQENQWIVFVARDTTQAVKVESECRKPCLSHCACDSFPAHKRPF